MRSLRSRQKSEAIVTSKSAKSKKGENSSPKMCNKRSKPGKAETRGKRQVLSDRTNSDLDTNDNSSVCTDSTMKRPKRTQHLPAKYQDHELSPVKGYRPECSSTPLPGNCKVEQKPTTSGNVKTRSKNVNTSNQENSNLNKVHPKNIKKKCVSTPKVVTPAKSASIPVTEISVPQKTETPIYKKGFKKSSTKEDGVLEKVVTPAYKKRVILLEKPKIQTPDRMALYEFDFDPNEEPTQTKKKRIRKKVPTAKKKTTKSNNTNDDAALQHLIERLKRIQEKQKCKKLLEKKKLANIQHTAPNVVPTIHVESDGKSVATRRTLPGAEGIECLSPIPRHQSPELSRPASPFIFTPSSPLQDIGTRHNISNSLNRPSNALRGSPIASSSMIVKSTRQTPASPWRAEGGAGVRRWPLNFHVKPSMTPSYERDTVHVIGLSDNGEQNSGVDPRKHVYTNISINTSHDDGDRSQKKISNWKQTSILSFYEESLKKSTQKRSLSPKKSLESYNLGDLIPQTNELSNSLDETPEKCINSEKADVENCFGFDDSLECDQENVSPAKIPKLQNINTIRGSFKAKRTRGILKEINQPHKQNLPMRAIPADILNIIEKQKFMEDIEEPRKETEVEKFPEVNINNSDSDDEVRDLDESLPLEETHSGQAELFAEPVEPELVHFSKTTRRSYGTRKRAQLTFLLPEKKDKDNESDYHSDDSSVSAPKVKKVTKKKKQSKAQKEKKEEVDNWVDNFNSMLEEVEDFPLCVE